MYMAALLVSVFIMTSCDSKASVSRKAESDPEHLNISSTVENSATTKDIVKNDLAIDGIPVSIPCTIDDMLRKLGSGYGVDEVYNLTYNGKETMTHFVTEYGDENMINSIGFRYDDYSDKESIIFSEVEKGILSFKAMNGKLPYSIEDVKAAYAFPGEEKAYGDSGEFTRLMYFDGEKYESEFVVQFIFSERGIETVFVNYYSNL